MEYADTRKQPSSHLKSMPHIVASLWFLFQRWSRSTVRKSITVWNDHSTWWQRRSTLFVSIVQGFQGSYLWTDNLHRSFNHWNHAIDSSNWYLTKDTQELVSHISWCRGFCRALLITATTRSTRSKRRETNEEWGLTLKYPLDSNF
jgi:hypothetical protein